MPAHLQMVWASGGSSWSQLPACAALLPREAGECPALGFGDNPKEPRASGTLREGAISNLGEPSL